MPLFWLTRVLVRGQGVMPRFDMEVAGLKSSTFLLYAYLSGDHYMNLLFLAGFVGLSLLLLVPSSIARFWGAFLVTVAHWSLEKRLPVRSLLGSVSDLAR